MILIAIIVALVLLAPLILMMIAANWTGVLLYLTIAAFVAAVISTLRGRFGAAGWWLIATSFGLMLYAANVWHTVLIPGEWYVWLLVAGIGAAGIALLRFINRMFAGAAVLVVTFFLVSSLNVQEISWGWWVLVAILVIAAIVLAVLRFFPLAFIVFSIALLVWLGLLGLSWPWLVVVGLVLAAMFILAFFSALFVVAIIALVIALVVALFAGISHWGSGSPSPDFVQGNSPSASATTTTGTPTPPVSTPSTETPTTQADSCPEFTQHPHDRGPMNRFYRDGIWTLISPAGAAAPPMEKVDAYLAASAVDAKVLAAYVSKTLPSEWPDPNNDDPLMNDAQTCLSDRGIELYRKLADTWHASGVINGYTPKTAYVTGIDGDQLIVSSKPVLTPYRTALLIALPNAQTVIIDDQSGATVYTSKPGNIPEGVTDCDVTWMPPVSPSPSPKPSASSGGTKVGNKGESGGSGTTSGSGSSGGSGTTSGKKPSGLYTPPHGPAPTVPPAQPAPTVPRSTTSVTVIPAPPVTISQTVR